MELDFLFVRTQLVSIFTLFNPKLGCIAHTKKKVDPGLSAGDCARTAPKLKSFESFPIQSMSYESRAHPHIIATINETLAHVAQKQ